MSDSLLSLEALNWLESVKYSSKCHEDRMILIKAAKIAYPLEKVNFAMSRDEILDVISYLSKGQGTYKRLYDSLNILKDSEPQKYEKYMQSLEEKNFKDSVDIVMYFEGCL